MAHLLWHCFLAAQQSEKEGRRLRWLGQGKGKKEGGGRDNQIISPVNGRPGKVMLKLDAFT